MPRLGTIRSLMVLGALLSGCKESSDDAPQVLDLESTAREVASVLCEALVNCGCTDAAVRADCETTYREYYLLMTSEMQTGNPSRRMDPIRARACLDEFRANAGQCRLPQYDEARSVRTAADYRYGGLGSLTLCENQQDVWVGTQTEGESCGASEDCIEALACDARTFTCAARKVAEEDCRYVDCQDGLICVDGLCQARPGAGEECAAGSFVSDEDGCQEGLSCAWVSGESLSRCFAPHAAGEDCMDGVPCVDGTFCSEGAESCVPKLVDGSGCDYDRQCVNGWCNELDKCQDPGICLWSPKK